VYEATMSRVGAPAYFRFTRDAVRGLERGLGLGRGLAYAHVVDGDEVVSSELVLLSEDTVYSFLGGSTPAGQAKRANDLLKHAVILWGGATGRARYVLGGGVHPNDGIFQY